MTSLFTIFALLSYNYLIFLMNIVKGIRIVKNEISENKNDEFISVIIPFRNEEKNILESLASIESQSLSKDRYEVIYVDDNSDDNSIEILRSAISSRNIKVITSDVNLEDRAHKKIALKKAIQLAEGEIIITTDADCVHGRDWLKTIVNMFDYKTAFVSGPVEFIQDESIFSQFQRLEFSGLILVGAGLIGLKEPIICNAANLGFRKSVYELVGGYADNLNLSSGDDEFLMQKISRETNFNIKFSFDRSAMSYTKPNSTFKQFFNQRKRWASKSFFYVKKSTTIKLTFIYLFYLGLLAQLLLGIFYSNLFFISLLFSLVLKIISEYQIVQIESEGLFSKVNNKLFLLAEMLQIPYIIIAGISGLFGNYEWKGRKIKR
jgi:cellulose synthase/poly-beta-1,6-N-acetylglucosamine synthase-like glycosyltransferase